MLVPKPVMNVDGPGFPLTVALLSPGRCRSACEHLFFTEHLVGPGGSRCRGAGVVERDTDSGFPDPRVGEWGQA